MTRLAPLAGLVLWAAVGWAAPHNQPQSDPAPQNPSARTAPAPSPQVTPLGEDRRVQPDDIDTLLAGGKVFFLDVREPKELEELGTREGYVNIPLGEIEKRLNELPRDKAILTA